MHAPLGWVAEPPKRLWALYPPLEPPCYWRVGEHGLQGFPGGVRV
jgi:hypothetical protein